VTLALASLICGAACGDGERWTVRAERFGPIPLGAPVAEAAAALGDSIPIDFAQAEDCRRVSPTALPRGTSLMILRDSAGAPPRVERVDVDTTGILTEEGAGVGDTEGRIQELYGERVRLEPHKYTTGAHYLVVTPPQDSLHRIVFETDGSVVVRYRAGRRPGVDFVEGCG
jgi:hypothetical protein